MNKRVFLRNSDDVNSTGVGRIPSFIVPALLLQNLYKLFNARDISGVLDCEHVLHIVKRMCVNGNNI